MGRNRQSRKQTLKSNFTKRKASSPSPVGKPLSRKETNAMKRCQQRFCTKYYVPKLKKTIEMYNPYNPNLGNNLSAYCSNTFCAPGSFTKIYNQNGELRNGFHKSFPTRRVKELKRLGALSGVTSNSFITR